MMVMVMMCAFMCVCDIHGGVGNGNGSLRLGIDTGGYSEDISMNVNFLHVTHRMFRFQLLCFRLIR